MNAARVDPPVIKIEQSAHCDRIVDRFIRKSRLVQRLNIGGLNGNRNSAFSAPESKDVSTSTSTLSTSSAPPSNSAATAA
jgi:hypothetical protein